MYGTKPENTRYSTSLTALPLIAYLNNCPKSALRSRGGLDAWHTACNFEYNYIEMARRSSDSQVSNKLVLFIDCSLQPNNNLCNLQTLTSICVQKNIAMQQSNRSDVDPHTKAFAEQHQYPC